MSVRYTIDQPFGLIIAGGQARRMGGGDKCLLPLGEGVVLDEIIARFAPQVQEVALNANGEPERFARFRLRVFPDIVPGLGPLGGISAGLTWIESVEADWLVTVAGDTPFVPQDLVPQLLDAAVRSQSPAAIAVDQIGGHPTCAIWHVTLAEECRFALTQRELSLSIFAAKVGATKAIFPGAQSFFNINTPEDLEQAQRLIAR